MGGGKKSPPMRVNWWAAPVAVSSDLSWLSQVPRFHAAGKRPAAFGRMQSGKPDLLDRTSQFLSTPDFPVHRRP